MKFQNVQILTLETFAQSKLCVSATTVVCLVLTEFAKNMNMQFLDFQYKFHIARMAG